MAMLGEVIVQSCWRRKVTGGRLWAVIATAYFQSLHPCSLYEDEIQSTYCFRSRMDPIMVDSALLEAWIKTKPKQTLFTKLFMFRVFYDSNIQVTKTLKDTLSSLIYVFYSIYTFIVYIYIYICDKSITLYTIYVHIYIYISGSCQFKYIWKLILIHWQCLFKGKLQEGFRTENTAQL